MAEEAQVGICPECSSDSTPFGKDEYNLREDGYFDRLQLCTNSNCRAVFHDFFKLSYTNQVFDGEIANMEEFREYVDENGEAL